MCLFMAARCDVQYIFKKAQLVNAHNQNKQKYLEVSATAFIRAQNKTQHYSSFF